MIDKEAMNVAETVHDHDTVYWKTRYLLLEQRMKLANKVSDKPWCIEHYPNPCQCDQQRDISVGGIPCKWVKIAENTFKLQEIPETVSSYEGVQNTPDVVRPAPSPTHQPDEASDPDDGIDFTGKSPMEALQNLIYWKNYKDTNGKNSLYKEAQRKAWKIAKATASTPERESGSPSFNEWEKGFIERQKQRESLEYTDGLQELNIDKIKNMLGAHNDGVYVLGSRKNIGTIVQYLINQIEGAKP